MRGLAIILLAGCGFETQKNLDGLDLGGADFAGADFAIPPGADLAIPPGADLAGADLSVRAGADLAVPVCAPPLLLIPVENVSGSSNGGRVQVMTLGDGTNTPQTCRVLSAQGNLTAQPMSAAMVDPGKLAVEGIDDLQLIDAQNDVILWSKGNSAPDFPRDVFALQHPDGRHLVAAAWASTSTSTVLIDRVDAWDQGGTAVKSWALNSTDIPLGLGITGMCAYPGTPTHFLALDVDNNQWAWDVDPWGAAKTGRNGMMSGSPQSIYADVWMGEVRTAWLDSGGSTSVVYNNDANGTSLLGPISCAGCTLVHVVPDPTLNTRFFGLCDGPSPDARRVVIFKSTGGTCDTILDGAAFGAQSRLSRLAVSQ